MWYRYRKPWHGRRIFILPFIFFIYMFSGMHNFVFAPILIIGAIVIASVFIAKALTASSNPPYQQTYTPFQGQSQYYRQQQEYQPPYQGNQEYQPYQQGYQAPQPVHDEVYKEGGQQYHSPEPERYQEYEQPQAQYPEQKPPLQ